jgi:hypothetical protein
MKTKLRPLAIVLATLALSAFFTGRLPAKEKVSPISPDDPTYRLYQFLDSNNGGKLADLYLLADVFKDPKKPDQEDQHVLRVEYEKERAFGKLRIYVRTVDRPSPDQLKTYTPKQIYEFAEVDSEKFTKTDAGLFGKAGDIYFHPVSEGGPLATAPLTDEARTEYEHYITDYILPALQKK